MFFHLVISFFFENLLKSIIIKYFNIIFVVSLF
jgi:hypothetical protein